MSRPVPPRADERVAPSRSFVPAALAFALALAAGCDFAPPPPPELRAIDDPRSRQAARSVELVMAGPEVDDRVIWEQACRQESGKAKVIFTTARLNAGDPPAKAADLVRAAVQRGVSALIVEPVDAPELSQALEEARAGGTAILLLDHPLPTRDPAKPFPVVTFVPFEPLARQLVEAVLKRAKVDGAPADGSAVILVNPNYGPDTEARVAALARALEAAGVTRVDRLTFDGKVDDGSKVLRARLEADPKLAVVLAHEEYGISAASAVHDELKGKHPFGVGGTAAVDRVLGPSILSACAALVDRNVPNFGRQALKEAVRLLNGEAVPAETFIPLPFHPLTGSDKEAAAHAEAQPQGPPGRDRSPPDGGRKP